MADNFKTNAEKQVARIGNATFTNLTQLEALAAPLLSRPAYDYYRGGSEDETTLANNRAAFARITLLPRMLVDVSRIDTCVTLFGRQLSSPLLVAPMALQAMAHPDGELATARACSSMGQAMVLSTMSNYSIKEVAATGAKHLFYQVYVLRDRELTASMVRDAERCGYCGIVVTVDAPRLGKREKDEANAFSVPAPLRLANLAALGGEAAVRPSAERGSGMEKHFEAQIDDSLTWEVVPWLRSITRLPILVKGLLHPADAELALAAGVDGIIVSNHGGRQVDGAPAAVDALPAVVAAVRRRLPVLVDGGVRRGSDVIKCMALGATAVLLGRPVLYGLALGGEAGVCSVLRLLQSELELTMALMGTPRLADISSQHVQAALGCCCPSSKL